MNKAFVREPDLDGRAYCPRCGSLGVRVGAAAMDTHCREEVRGRIREAAWFCAYPRCEVAYFNTLEAVILVDELRSSIYPKDPDAPLCACFGFTMEEVLADVADGVPTRIRQLLARSQSPEARCTEAAPDGQCCLREVQRLYIKHRP